MRPRFTMRPLWAVSTRFFAKRMHSWRPRQKMSPTTSPGMACVGPSRSGRMTSDSAGRAWAVSGPNVASGWDGANWKSRSPDRDRVSSQNGGQGSNGGPQKQKRKRERRGRWKPQRDVNGVRQLKSEGWRLMLPLVLELRHPWRSRYAASGCLSLSASLCLLDPATQLATQDSTSWRTTCSPCGCND